MVEMGVDDAADSVAPRRGPVSSGHCARAWAGSSGSSAASVRPSSSMRSIFVGMGGRPEAGWAVSEATFGGGEKRGWPATVLKQPRPMGSDDEVGGRHHSDSCWVPAWGGAAGWVPFCRGAVTPSCTL
jgi:hypothetical protein